MNDNLKFWESVQKTDPNHTKQANVKGHNITAIAPQYQILNATKKFGMYGKTWGFSGIDIDTTLKEFGLVTFKGVFFFPEGEFPIISSISIWKDNAKTKIDSDFAKKVETDALTKALSKLGFNADIFMGRYDDVKYLNELKEEFKPDNRTEIKFGDTFWHRIVKAKASIQAIEKTHKMDDDTKKKYIETITTG